ncbi:TPA: chloride channel protein [Clostridium perfringens]
MKKYFSLGILILYGIFLGGVVGAVSWLFLSIVSLGIHFMWNELPGKINFPYWTLLVCSVGGILVGLCQKYLGEYPKLMPEVMAEFKKTKRVDYKNVPKACVSALITLFFGASLGPEAALVNIIGGLSTLVGDILKWTVKDKELQKYDSVVTEFSMEAALGLIFHAPLIGLTPLIEGDDSKVRKNIKTIIYSITTAAGFAVLILLSQIDNRPSFIVHFGNFSLGVGEVVSIIPLIVCGILMALLYGLYGKILHKVFLPLKNYKIIRALIGGIILGIVGTLLPYTLFSGEHEVKELVKEWSTLSVWILILISLLKLFLTEVCLSTGWRGGHIFPVIFSGVSMGYALSTIFSIDPVVTVTIVTTAFTSAVLRNAVVTLLLLVLFFPSSLIWVMLIAAFLSAYVLKKWDSRGNQKEDIKKVA